MAEDRASPAQALYDQASAAYAAGDHEDAIRLYRAAVRSDPEPAVVEVELFVGEILVGLGRDDEAVQSYRVVIGEDPQNHQAWRMLGEALGRLGRQVEADAALANADRFEVLDLVGQPGDEVFAEYQRAADTEDRARLVIDLVQICHPRLDEVFRSFLASSRDVDFATCSHTVCEAFIEALVGVGVQEHHGIFSDGNAPDRTYIQENVERYLARGSGDDRRRRGWFRRLLGRESPD